MVPNIDESKGTKAPKLLMYIRILMLVEITRLAGLLFLTIPNETVPAYFTLPFGLGDTLTGVFAVILALSLGKGGVRTYGMAVAWSVFGVLDGLLGLGVAINSGLMPTISGILGPALIILPVGLVIGVVVFFLLMTKSVSQYLAHK
jgi:hypothetical protein